MGDSVRHRRTSGAEAPQFGLCYVAPEGGTHKISVRRDGQSE